MNEQPPRRRNWLVIVLVCIALVPVAILAAGVLAYVAGTFLGAR